MKWTAPPRAVKPLAKERWDADNLYCARVYAADPAKYPGTFQQYARLVLKRLGTKDEQASEQ